MIDIRGLAYVVAQSTDLARWKRYAEGVLGMMTATAPGDGLYVKMDERQYRMLVLPGRATPTLASGWEVLDRAAFEAGLGVLKAQGVAFELADASLCDQRRDAAAGGLQATPRAIGTSWSGASSPTSPISPPRRASSASSPVRSAWAHRAASGRVRGHRASRAR